MPNIVHSLMLTACLPARQVHRIFKKTVNREPLTVNKRLRRSAFTLIELLLVIALIGILSSFGVYGYQSSQIKARDTQRKSDLDAIKKGLEAFNNDTAGAAKYPSTITASLVQGNYMQNLPADPKTKSNYIYTPHLKNGSTDCQTFYNTPETASDGDCRTYKLTACLENDNDNGSNTLTKPISGDGSTCPGNRIYQITSQ